MVAPISEALHPAVLKAFGVILSILCFFTVLFLTWRLITPKKFLREMLLRTASWWVIFTLFLVFMCWNAKLGVFGFFLLAFFSLKELLEKFNPREFPINAKRICLALVAGHFVIAAYGELFWAVTYLPVVAFLTVSLYVVLFEDVETIFTVPSVSLWCLLLTTSGFNHLALIYRLPQEAGSPGAIGWLVYFLFLVQFNDVLQFLCGKLLGRRKIAPVLSPNKTWEGFLGGLILTTIIAYGLRFLTPLSQTQSLTLGFLLALTGFLGDLGISAIKRKIGIKNMSELIPGHGGLLDRVDSVTLSSLVYFYLIYYWHFDGVPLLHG